jgi:hypothetical protein
LAAGFMVSAGAEVAEVATVCCGAAPPWAQDVCTWLAISSSDGGTTAGCCFFFFLVAFTTTGLVISARTESAHMVNWT